MPTGSTGLARKSGNLAVTADLMPGLTYELDQQEAEVTSTEFFCTTGVTPPLKWAGGKRWQLPYLRTYWGNHDRCRLVEPFCGGLSVALGLSPASALLNDVNPHLINFYRWLKRGLTISLEMENSASHYYLYRERFNELLSTGKSTTKEAASLFYYLNRTGYNGLCRFNRAGEFNVPFGLYSRINYQRDFGEYKPVISRWQFLSKPFDRLTLHPTDFVYADPPYDVEFTQYAKGGFSWQDQIDTAEWLARHSGPAVLSNQATKRIERLYRKLGFKLVYLRAPRRISCTGDRTPATEVLALKNI
ncbi:MAG: DNA adenine methylase [Pyrinomonadaceae bacterium]